MSTTYQEIKKKVGARRGRPALPEDERKRRAEARKVELRRRMEARRRAWFVLQHRYNDEFQRIYTEEYEILTNTNYAGTSRKSSK